MNCEVRIKSRSSGFSLIELLIVMGMLAILALVAVPDFRQYQMREALRESVSLTQSALSDGFAKARAESQHQIVTVQGNGLEICNEPQDTTVTPECKLHELPGSIEIKDAAVIGMTWKYLAPHGDLDLTSSLSIELEHASGEKKTLKIYHRSGLIEEQ